MISPDCTIKEPAPTLGSKCWEPDCRAPLPPRAQKWCTEHRGRPNNWIRNHKWWAAKPEALRRATRQVRVKRPVTEYVFGKGFVETAELRDVWEQFFECALCGSLTDKPEVDHITAWSTQGGNRNRPSCLNHQDNLRVLDNECHKERTRAQRASGAF